MKELITLIKLNIPHKVIYTKYKRLVLKYDRNGVLNVRCPKTIKDSEIEEFVTKHLDWVIKNYEIYKKEIKTYNTGDKYLYLGINYTLKIVINRHTGVFINNNELIVYVKNESDVKKELNIWRKNQAETVFEELTFQVFKQMENDLNVYPKLGIKKYIARWGCCYPRKNQIYLNISLIHVPIYLITYVIFHEFAHFKYQNHQKEFHDYLKRYVPNELKLKKELSKYKADYE